SALGRTGTGPWHRWRGRRSKRHSATLEPPLPILTYSGPLSRGRQVDETRSDKEHPMALQLLRDWRFTPNDLSMAPLVIAHAGWHGARVVRNSTTARWPMVGTNRERRPAGETREPAHERQPRRAQEVTILGLRPHKVAPFPAHPGPRCFRFWP